MNTAASRPKPFESLGNSVIKQRRDGTALIRVNPPGQSAQDQLVIDRKPPILTVVGARPVVIDPALRRHPGGIDIGRLRPLRADWRKARIRCLSHEPTAARDFVRLPVDSAAVSPVLTHSGQRGKRPNDDRL